MSKEDRKQQMPAAGSTESAEPVENTDPDTGTEQAREDVPEAEQRRKLHRRYLRMMRNLVIRIALLALVVYILFVHLVGLTIMPNGDMYPRIDAGDLILFYRLERSFHAQDIIVFEKPTALLGLTEGREEAEAAGREITEAVLSHVRAVK